MSTTQRVQCALYQLGYNAQLLIVISEDRWFAADRDTPFPKQQSSVHAEIQANAAAAENLVDVQTVRARVQQIAALARDAWNHFRQKWAGRQHLDIIRTLADANNVRAIDENGVPSLDDEWWSQATPLTQRPFVEFRRAIRDSETDLTSQFAPCFVTGRLVAQVLTLPYNSSKQDRVRGERLPIVALRQRLLELRQRVPVLSDLDINLPEVFSPVAGVSQSEYAKGVVEAAHTRIISRLSALAPSSARRRPGRPFDSEVAERDKWIRKHASKHSGLKRAELLAVLVQEMEAEKKDYKLTKDTLRNAIRPRDNSD